MQQKPLSWHLIILTCILVLPPIARAIDWPVFEPVRMEALFNYNQWKRQNDQTDSDEYDLQASIRIEGAGYWFHPEIVSFNYYLEPTYFTGNFTIRDQRSDQISRGKWQGDGLNYSLNFNVLQGTTLPIYSTLITSQSLTTNHGSFGQKSQTNLKRNSLLLGWKNSYFPLTFKFRMRDYYTVNDPGLGRPRFIRDDLEQIFSINGKSSKTDLELLQRSMDDRVVSRNNDFDESIANLGHRLSWGDGSNLTSQFRYRNRSGFNSVERIYFRERVNIQHGEYFDSQTLYQYNSTTQNIKSTTNIGSFSLKHQYYQNLTTSGNLRAEDRRSDDSHLTKREVGLRFSYQKSDFFGAVISANLGGKYGINDLDSQAGFMEVFEQPYLLSFTGEVVLDDPFIATSTIIVTDVTSTIEFTEGIDYEIIPITDNLTQLFIIPGGQINSGDTILVTYKAAVLPSVKYSALDSTTGFSFRKGWFSLSHYGTQRNINTISGNGDFLIERRNSTTRMEIQWDMARTTNQFSAERRFSRDGTFETTTYTLTQSINASLTPHLIMNLSLSGSHSESNLENINMYVLNLNFLWRPTPHWTIRPVLGIWKRERSDIPDTASGIKNERILSASLSVRWSLRKIDLDFSVRHNDRMADEARFLDDNLTLNLRRRF